MSKISNKKALISILVVMVMVLSAFLVITPTSSATSATNSKNSGKMNVSTDLGNNVALVAGSIGITLPNAINSNFTKSPGVVAGSITSYPGYSIVNEELLFTVSGTFGGLPPYYYTWQFFNSAGKLIGTASGQSTYYSFSKAGTYKAVATVTDAVGNSANTSYLVNVYNTLNIKVSPSSTNIYAGQSVTFTYTISGGSGSYYLDANYGNGITYSSYPYTVPGIGTLGPIKYSLPGQYLAVFQVRDTAGMTTSSSYWINVTPAQVNATVAPIKVTTYLTTLPWPNSTVSSVYMYQTVYDTVSISGGTGYYNVTVIWGDGNVSYGTSHWITSKLVSFMHPNSTAFPTVYGYTLPAQYIIRVYVNDSIGQSALDLEFIRVIYTPPSETPSINVTLPNGTITTVTGQNNAVSATVTYGEAETNVTLLENITGGEMPYHWYLFNETKELNNSVQKYPFTTFPVFNFTWYFKKYFNTPGIYHFVIEVNDSLNNTVYSNYTITVISPHLQVFIASNLPYPENFTSGCTFIGSKITYYVYVGNIQLNATGHANITIAFNNGYTMRHNDTVNIAFKGTPYSIIYPVVINPKTMQPETWLLFNASANSTFTSAIGSGNLTVTYRIFGTFTAYATSNYGKTYNTTTGSPIYYTKDTYVLCVSKYQPISVMIYTIPYPAITTGGNNIQVFVNMTGGNGAYSLKLSNYGFVSYSINYAVAQSTYETIKIGSSYTYVNVSVSAGKKYPYMIGTTPYFNISYNMSFSRTGFFTVYGNATDPTGLPGFHFPYYIGVEILPPPQLSVSLTATSHYSCASEPRAINPPFKAFLNISGSAYPYYININFGGSLLYLNVYENGTYLPSLSAVDVAEISSSTQTVSGGFYVPGLPANAVYDPATGYAYIGTGNEFFVVNPANNALLGNITASGYNPMISTPYTTNMLYDSANGFIYALSSSGQIYVLNTTSILNSYGFVNFTIPVGMNPTWMAFNQKAQLIYVANEGSGNISVISAVNNTDFASIPLLKGIMGIAYVPTNNELYVTNSTHPIIYVLNATTGKLITELTWAGSPSLQLLYANGFIYAATTGNKTVAGENITVYNPAKNTFVANISTGVNYTYGMQYNPSDGMVYVTSSGGYVSIISGTTLVNQVYVGGEPTSLFSANGNMYVLSLTLTNGKSISSNYYVSSLYLVDKKYSPVSFMFVGTYLNTGTFNGDYNTTYLTSDHMIWANVTSSYPKAPYSYFENVTYDEYAVPYIELDNVLASAQQVYSGESISFDAMPIFGEFPNMHQYTYYWIVYNQAGSIVYFNETTTSAISLSFTVTQCSEYTLYVYVESPCGEYAVYYLEFEVMPWPVIEQVISARVYATLQGPSGNVYTAYAGPADWNQNGTVMASFPMPNVPNVNEVYTLNVSYSYTIGVTIWTGGPCSSSSEQKSWETYFYNVYSTVPYASQSITVVSGGVLVSTGQSFSQIEAQINGVWNTLNVSSSNIQSALSSGFKTVNGNLVTIQTQGSEILANISTINGQITNINGNIATITSDIGTMQTTLGSINAQITGINGNIATITTDIGTINTTLSSINAHITSIDGNIATITSDAGTISTTLSAINAQLTAVNGTVATIKTNVGTIQTSLSSIGATVSSISSNVNNLVGTTATIQTDLGTITGTVTSINGTVATIQTKLGTLQANVNTLSNTASNTMTWSIGVLVLVIITLVLVLVVMMQVNKISKQFKPKEEKKTPEEKKEGQ